MRARDTNPPPTGILGILGIEAGGTRTSACWMPVGESPTPPIHFGPANLKLLTESQLRRHLRAVAGEFPKPVAVGIGMAGARTREDQARLKAAAERIWPNALCVATHDLDTALAATDTPPTGPRILVLSGTGSCCYGRDSRGRTARVGGWGHLLGDQGSGYDIAIQALRHFVEAWDLSGTWGLLGRKVLEFLHFNEPDHLVAWIHAAGKDSVAALAPVVFEAAAHRDPIARRTIDRAANDLAAAACACARRLALRQVTDAAPEFILAGGVLLRQPAFARAVTRRIRREMPSARVGPLRTSGAAGAARLALDAWRSNPRKRPADGRDPAPPVAVHASGNVTAEARPVQSVVPASARLSPTEERHPRSMRLDRLRPGAAIDLLLSEEARIPDAIRAEKPRILRALRVIHKALSTGGRLFYVGAGTSGRLGVLDASECPPTFRSPPEWVQGIIAGGAEAVFRAVEGAEDDVDAGRRAMEFRGIGRRDVVVGIAASGRTPFVWGSLSEARHRGATTVLIAFNPHLVFDRGQRPDIVITPAIGPELLTGSTRLRAGTATKLILNALTTLTMVRLGKVVSNLMVDLNPANAKLRERAVRITRELTGADGAAAREALVANRWVVKDAIRLLGRRRPGQRQT
ncbi:MAG: N-acetylmuramic acid 6-phosphate etherase [Limisphaerales bacterium]